MLISISDVLIIFIPEVERSWAEHIGWIISNYTQMSTCTQSTCMLFVFKLASFTKSFYFLRESITNIPYQFKLLINGHPSVEIILVSWGSYKYFLMLSEILHWGIRTPTQLAFAEVQLDMCLSAEGTIQLSFSFLVGVYQFTHLQELAVSQVS